MVDGWDCHLLSTYQLIGDKVWAVPQEWPARAVHSEGLDSALFGVTVEKTIIGTVLEAGEDAGAAQEESMTGWGESSAKVIGGEAVVFFHLKGANGEMQLIWLLLTWLLLSVTLWLLLPGLLSHVFVSVPPCVPSLSDAAGDTRVMPRFFSGWLLTLLQQFPMTLDCLGIGNTPCKEIWVNSMRAKVTTIWQWFRPLQWNRQFEGCWQWFFQWIYPQKVLVEVFVCGHDIGGGRKKMVEECHLQLLQGEWIDNPCKTGPMGEI